MRIQTRPKYKKVCSPKNMGDCRARKVPCWLAAAALKRYSARAAAQSGHHEAEAQEGGEVVAVCMQHYLKRTQ
jgi:hypothetical protein